MESRFFALYEVTDKGTSWMGPLVIAAIQDSTGVRGVCHGAQSAVAIVFCEFAGNMRLGFFYFIVMYVVPFCLLFLLDVDRGRREAAAFSKRFAVDGAVLQRRGSAPAPRRGVSCES